VIPSQLSPWGSFAFQETSVKNLETALKTPFKKARFVIFELPRRLMRDHPFGSELPVAKVAVALPPALPIFLGGSFLDVAAWSGLRLRFSRSEFSARSGPSPAQHLPLAGIRSFPRFFSKQPVPRSLRRCKGARELPEGSRRRLVSSVCLIPME